MQSFTVRNKMKVSKLTEEKVNGLTPKDKWELVCNGADDSGDTAEFALLLGTKPEIARERAEAAAELYRSGRVKYIIPSGGVEWETENGEKLSEACYMAYILAENGVPDKAILLENEAKTTKENMIFGALLINRRTKFYGDKKVIIVTSDYHMKRSLLLARTFMPSFVKLGGYPAKVKGEIGSWLENKDNVALLDTEIYLFRSIYSHGLIEDTEI